MTADLWQVRLQLTGDQDIASEVLLAASDAATISMSHDDEDEPWDVMLICQTPPDQNRLDKAVETLAADFAMAATPPVVSVMPEIDWLQKNWKDMKPLEIGQFWIYGTHIIDPVPGSKIGIQLDAGMAFGTGNHATTHGCIVLAEKHIKTSHAPKIADIGSGSGILAIAAAKLDTRSQIIAVDNDPVAVAVMTDNVKHNQTDQQITCGLSDGYDSPYIHDHAPFDLIMANILPSPLITMAAAAARALRHGGKIILSGLNLKHADDVIAAHAAVGLVHIESLPVGDWMTVLMQKPNGENP